MPRQKSPEPRLFIADGGAYPFGPFVPETPMYALAAALFTRNLLAYMDGSLSIHGGEPSHIQQDPSAASLLRKTEMGRAVLSRLMNGVAYPDMTTVTRLEAYTNADLWGSNSERLRLLDGTYDPSNRPRG